MTALAQKIDLSRLSKVLALTASPVDHEALVAARKAAQLLTAANLTYGDVIVDRHASTPPKNTNPDKVLKAWVLVRELRDEVSRLRAQIEAGGGDENSALWKIRARLLSEVPLRAWERQSLSQINDIKPRSREEFYIRWLARLYALEH